MTSNEFRNTILKKNKGLAMTANQATRQILDYLNMTGFYAWRNNNNAVYDPKKEVFRSGSVEKGVADIMGYQKKSGIIIAVEVKVGNDKPTPEQTRFIDGIAKAGGFACFASCAGDVAEYLEKHQINPAPFGENDYL